MESLKAKNVNHPDHVENLKQEKYGYIREAILAVLPTAESGESLSFDELEAGVRAHLLANDVPMTLFPKPGSVRWYTKAVQLDLESRGEIERLPKKSPIRLRRTPDS
jgi:hypothetical protein